MKQDRFFALLLRGAAAGVIGLAAFALVLVSPGQRAEAAFGGVTNGSFETPGGSSGQINAGSAALTGWTVGGHVDYVCGGWQNADGNCSLDMGATPSQGQISQILATTAGNHYTVKFMMAGNPGCSSTSANWVTWSWPLDEPGVKTLNVSATGAVGATYSFDVAGKSDTNMGWTAKTYLFTATSASTTLTFQNGTNQVCGAALDKIEVTEAPAGPATLGATTWQGVRPYSPVSTPAYPTHGNIGFYNHIPGPVPGANDAGWANCGPGNPICPNANTIGLSQLSRLAGYTCLAAADFTFYQAFVSIPFETTISQFSVNMSGADDGARVAIYNSAYPGGFIFSGSYIYLGGAQSTTDMSSAMVAGEVNRVLITQVDDCYSGNNLNSAQIFLNGTVLPPTPPSDTTPPVITPTVTGTLGDNGWYTSDVNVSWTVTDPDSTISLQTGCGPTTVSTDTASVTFTCTATSVGGTASQSVTLKRDATAPATTATAAPAANGNGWNNTDVTVTFTGTDGMSGVASCAVPVVLNTEGAGQSASGTCMDNAGNVSAPATASNINIDKTAPAATATAAPAANGNGWNNTDVTVTFTGTDGMSGVASCADPVVLSAEGAGQSASGTCMDNAGNVSAPATASNINVDKTNPVVTVTGVTNGATYIVGGVPAAGCTTNDALSGVATSATLSTAGGPLATVTVTCAGATDKAGNAAPAVTATYSVTYAFCGFKQPLLVPVQEFKAGSTIPVKFCVQDANGVSVATATGTVEAYVNGSLMATTYTIRYDASGQQYIANVQTKDGKTDWPTGTLELRVKLNDGTTHSTNVLSTSGVKGGLKLK